MAARLFHVDMFAGLQPGDGHGRMPMVGCSDGYRIHVFLLEDLAEILVRNRLLAGFLLRAVCELPQNIAVYVADMRNTRSAPVRLERRKMRITASVKSDHRKVHTLVRAHNLAIALGRARHRQPRRAYRQRIEKLPS